MSKQKYLYFGVFFFPLIAVVGQIASAHPNGIRVETADGAYTNISAQNLHSLLTHKTFLLINVHVPYEGEIEGTDALIPFEETEKIVKILPADKAAMIVLYCRSGRMSGETVTALVKLGYTNVWHLERGMIEWKEANFPIVIRKAP